jgi:hypothetical protein
MSNWLVRLAPRPSWVRLAVVPVLVLVAQGIDRNYLLDFWHHLARGRAMAEQGALVDHDLFTFTVAGQPFQDVNWLTQLIYYGLFRIGGLGLVQCANALTLALMLLLLVLFCRRVSGSLGTATFVGAFTFFGLWQVLTIRPQTFSLLLFVILYDLLDRAEAGRRWLLLWPPLLLALWANLHGAFPAGLLLVGCFLLAAAWRAWRGGVNPLRDPLTRALALCLAACVLATLVNPYGWRVYQYVGATSSRAAERGILEWLPPRLEMLIGKVWAVSLALLVLLVAAAWWRLGRKPRAREVLLVLCFLPPACGSVRMVAWWLIVFAPLAATLLASLSLRTAGSPAEPERPSWGAGLVFAVLLLIALVSVPGLERFNPVLGFRPRERRIEAGLEEVHRHLAAGPGGGRVFSRFEWGEYLAWTGAPRFPVFIDGRIEIYPDDVWEEYLRLTQGKKGWDKILDAHGVDYLVLDANYHADGLLPHIEQSPSWRQALRIDEILLYERRPGLQAAQGR